MILHRNVTLGAALASAMLCLCSLPAFAQTGEPSRPAMDKCAWAQRSDAAIGLAAWVERCDFGFRKIDLFFDNGSLSIQYSDGGEPDPLVQVLPMLPGETTELALRRLFDAGTDPAIAERCELAPATLIPPPVGVERYTFVPNPEYQAELAAAANPDEVPKPPCGDWGDMPDGIQYFEVQPDSGARNLLFVRAGQDTPLFDEQTLQLLPAGPYAGTGPADCCGYKTGDKGVVADFLMESCSVPGDTAYGMIPFFDCQSYVMGVVDSVRAMNAGPNAKLCLPADLTAGGVLQLLGGNYDDEADGQKRASDILLAAIDKTFACKK